MYTFHDNMKCTLTSEGSWGLLHSGNSTSSSNLYIRKGRREMCPMDRSINMAKGRYEAGASNIDV